MIEKVGGRGTDRRVREKALQQVDNQTQSIVFVALVLPSTITIIYENITRTVQHCVPYNSYIPVCIIVDVLLTGAVSRMTIMSILYLQYCTSL